MFDKMNREMTQECMELKPPLWPLIAYPLIYVGGFYCYVFLYLAQWFKSPHRGDVGFILLTFSLAGFGVWLIWRGIASIRRDLSFRIRADSTGATMHYRSKKSQVSWSHIYSCSVEHEGFEGYAQWVTLRDEQNGILLQWDLDWYNYDDTAIKRFDAFTKFVQDKIEEQKT